MKIFARGTLVGLVVGVVILIIYPDISDILSDGLIITAFVCGAITEIIIQIKGEE